MANSKKPNVGLRRGSSSKLSRKKATNTSGTPTWAALTGCVVVVLAVLLFSPAADSSSFGVVSVEASPETVALDHRLRDTYAGCKWNTSHHPSFSPQVCNFDPAAVSPYASFITDEKSSLQGVSVKFVNLMPYTVWRYWNDGTDGGQFQGPIVAGHSEQAGTYVSHVFFITHKVVQTDGTEMEERMHRFDVRPESSVFIIDGDDPQIQATKRYKEIMKEKNFVENYRKRTGRPWLSHYPRSPPQYHMWSAEYPGQTHTVASKAGYWTKAQPLGLDANSPGVRSTLEPIKLELRTLAVSPKIFLIEDLLSQFEVEHLLALAAPHVRRSLVGQETEDGTGFHLDTRTSSNHWISRSTDALVDNLYRRMADVLRIPESALTERKSAEPLQVVHYAKGQFYYNHYDFFSTNAPNTRYLTLFFYLKPPEGGGGTGFPKALGGHGLKVTPKAGSAILFYSLLEDGNSDHMSEHSGLNVTEGEKWGANLWVWDPYKL